MNHKIKFSNIRFDAVLCLNGEISHFEYIKEFKGNIYCADGAAYKLIYNDIAPDYVIGDLDSINENLIKEKYPDIVFYKKESQESNDFEKCLDYMIDKNIDNILIFGLQGGELEHTLNNWSVLKRFADKLNLVVLHKNRYAFVVKNNSEIELKENELVSLIPQPKCLLTTSGLKWNLKNEYLEIGKREGARNLVESQNVHLDIHEGELLFFIDSRYPYSIIFDNKG